MQKQLLGFMAGNPAIVIAVFAVAGAVAVFFLFKMARRRKRSADYVRRFGQFMDGGGNKIEDGLKYLLGVYKPNSLEYKAIDQALFYLYHSLMHDYESALRIIETVFFQDSVAEFHDRLIEAEYRNMYYFLEREK